MGRIELMDRIPEMLNYIQSKNDSMFRYKVYKKEVDSRIYTVISLHYLFMSVDEVRALPDYYREMRGMVYVKRDGKPIDVFRAISILFTLNQYEEVSLDAIGDKKIDFVSDKLDGSMIVPYILDGKVFFKTRRSFEHDILDAIENEVPYIESVKDLVRDLYREGFDAVFEYTSPSNTVVVKYDIPSLSIVQVRDRRTGEYINPEDLYYIFGKYPEVPITEHRSIDMTLREFVERTRGDPSFIPFYDKYNGENFEGFVIKLEDGQLIKFKTNWYFERHGKFDFEMRLRRGNTKQLEEMILDQRLDEIPYDVRNRYSDLIEKTNRKVMRRFNSFATAVESFMKEIDNGKDVRSLVDEVSKHGNLAVAIFYALRGYERHRDVDLWSIFKNYYRKVYRKD